MQPKPNVVVIIPAYNESQAVGKVIADIPKKEVSLIIVVDNNSNDNTARSAADAGALVLKELRQGYGYACLKGIDYVQSMGLNPDILVFLDSDYSDHPDQLPALIAPIIEGNADMVIGSRALGARERGSMTLPQQFGNWLATALIKRFYGVSYTDLGPFRAIKWPVLLAMDMRDTTYGWTVEMQLKAAKSKLRIAEVPVDYRVRIGYSKVSGTVKGTLLAGYKIITTIFKYL